MTENIIRSIEDIKTYALVVDGEFACLFRFPKVGNPSIEMITAALSSKPEVVDMTGTGIPDDGTGWYWDGSNLLKEE
jgi:hypothetical protein